MKPLSDSQYLYIVPRVLQRSKKYRGHNSRVYNASSQWVMKRDTHSLFYNKKYPWISNLEELCSIHLFDLVLTLYISDRTCDKNLF